MIVDCVILECVCSCEIAMGDLQSEEERDILLECQLPKLSEPASDLVVKAQMVYFNVISSSMDTVNSNWTVERNSGPRGEPSMKLDSQRNRIIASKALNDARALADAGNYAEAKKILEAAVKRITESVSVGEQFCQGLLNDLVKASESMKSKHEYKSHGAKFMMSKMQTHSAQRANLIDDDDISPYTNASRGIFVAKSKAMKKF
jgi:hypothetical protein